MWGIGAVESQPRRKCAHCREVWGKVGCGDVLTPESSISLLHRLSSIAGTRDEADLRGLYPRAGRSWNLCCGMSSGIARAELTTPQAGHVQGVGACAVPLLPEDHQEGFSS